MKYSIWLDPQGELKQRFSKIIKDLSLQSNTPQFSPHVTLLGELDGQEEEIIAKTAKLARLIKPYQIELTGEIAFEEVWSRAMIVLVKNDPEVMEANTVATRMFGVKSQTYTPHLSLMYTKTVPVDRESRLQAAQNLDPNLLKGSFQVESLSLNRIYEDIEKWDQVKSFSLS